MKYTVYLINCKANYYDSIKKGFEAMIEASKESGFASLVTEKGELLSVCLKPKKLNSNQPLTLWLLHDAFSAPKFKQYFQPD